MKNILIAIKSFIIFSVLLGLVYPLTITGIAQIAFPQKANGSLITENGQVVGSSLIGQKFDKPEYFNSRPSAVDYNAAGSGASNLAPSSKKLIQRVKDAKTQRCKDAKKFENYASMPLCIQASIPADMVLTSASGLDPHISIENAKLQAKRVAKIRSISENQINKLIEKNTDHEFLGVWGQEGVNVLKLNIALDREFNKEGK